MHVYNQVVAADEQTEERNQTKLFKKRVGMHN